MDISLITKEIQAFSKRVGRSMARTPILLYLVLQDDKTSVKDKAIIATCLAYLILPIDIIPARKFSILGWADEILSVEIVFDRMRKYMTPELVAKGEELLDMWIPMTGKPSTKFYNIKPSNQPGSCLDPVEAIANKWKK